MLIALDGRLSTLCCPSPCQKAAINNRKNGHTGRVPCLFAFGIGCSRGVFAQPVTSKRSAISPMLRSVLRAHLTGIQSLATRRLRRTCKG
jgi:hypothetical protein